MEIKDIDLEQAYKNPIHFQNATFDYIDKEQNLIKQLICIQVKINRIVLINSSYKYVYKINETKDLRSLKEIRKAFFKNIQYDISHMKISDNIVLRNIKNMKYKLTGCKAYGDYEDIIAITLAPIVDINQFSNNILQIKQEIENIPERIGLIDFWIDAMSRECNELYALGVSI